MSLTCSNLVLAPPRYDPAEPGEPGLPPAPDPPSEILADRFWIGGSPADFGWLRRQGVTVVADLADADAHPDPADISDIAYLKHPFTDAGDLPDLVVLEGVVSTVADALAAGRRVLVHCTWGRNRSGLVAALVLRSLLDVDGGTALRLVRERRRRALNNEVFAGFLGTLPAPGSRGE